MTKQKLNFEKFDSMIVFSEYSVLIDHFKRNISNPEQLLDSRNYFNQLCFSLSGKVLDVYQFYNLLFSIPTRANEIDLTNFEEIQQLLKILILPEIEEEFSDAVTQENE